jgi:hypothetical protein
MSKKNSRSRSRKSTKPAKANVQAPSQVEEVAPKLSKIKSVVQKVKARKASYASAD